MRFALIALLGLAACSSPEPTAPASSGGDLSPRQAADLAALGLPVLVPGDAGGFALTSVQVERTETDGMSIADYALLYRRDGACIEVRGTNDGVGGPELPAESRTVRLDDVGGRPSVSVHRASTEAASQEAEMWGAGTVMSEFIELGAGADLMLVSVWSTDALGDADCRPASLDAVAALTASLYELPSAQVGTNSGAPPRPPAPPPPPAPTDLTDLGDFAPAPTVQNDPAIQSGATPEDASRGLAERYGSEAQSVQVQIVQSVGREATVLVTAEGLADDSVAGERHRLMYRQSADGAWELEDAGVQVRCHARRGHTDWSAQPCS